MAASSSSWACNWPREGGAAKSGPMTLNRKWAQRSCGRKIDDVSFTGCHYFYFPHIRWCGQGFTPAFRPVSPGILCGPKILPHIDHPKGIEPVVIGERNLSSASNRSRRSSTPKASQNDRGKVFRSMGGENRARATLQKGLWTKVCNHHSRQCSNVRRATPRPSRKACSRGGVIPCCIAATSTTTKPQ